MTKQLKETINERGELMKETLPEGILCRVRYPICNIGERNKNKRVYEADVWENGVLKDTEVLEKMENRTLYGESEHPEESVLKLNKDTTSHIISKIFVKEGKAYADLDILPTEAGKFISVLLEAGCLVGTSTRADGELEEKIDEESGDKFYRVIPEAYKFITVDFTGDPSTLNALPEDVQHNIVTVTKEQLAAHTITNKTAMALLEKVSSDEAKVLRESIQKVEEQIDAKKEEETKAEPTAESTTSIEEKEEKVNEDCSGLSDEQLMNKIEKLEARDANPDNADQAKADIKHYKAELAKRGYKKESIDEKEETYYSNCCTAAMPNHPDSDVCPKCKEHCSAVAEKDLKEAKIEEKSLTTYIKDVYYFEDKDGLAKFSALTGDAKEKALARIKAAKVADEKEHGAGIYKKESIEEAKIDERGIPQNVEFQIETTEEDIIEYKAEVIADVVEDSGYGADADGNRGVYMSWIEDVQVDSLYDTTNDQEVDFKALSDDEQQVIVDAIISALDDRGIQETNEAKNEGEVNWEEYKGKKIKLTVQPSGSSKLVQLGTEEDFRPGRGASFLVGYTNTRKIDNGKYAGEKTSEQDLINKAKYYVDIFDKPEEVQKAYGAAKTKHNTSLMSYLKKGAKATGLVLESKEEGTMTKPVDEKKKDKKVEKSEDELQAKAKKQLKSIVRKILKATTEEEISQALDRLTKHFADHDVAVDKVKFVKDEAERKRAELKAGDKEPAPEAEVKQSEEEIEEAEETVVESIMESLADTLKEYKFPEEQKGSEKQDAFEVNGEGADLTKGLKVEDVVKKEYKDKSSESKHVDVKDLLQFVKTKKRNEALTENYKNDVLILTENLSAAIAEYEAATTQLEITSNELILKNEEIANLTANLSKAEESIVESKTLNETKITELKDSATQLLELTEKHEKEIAELKEAHTMGLLKKYREAICKTRGLKLPPNLKTLFEGCKTEEEVDDFLLRAVNLIREGILQSDVPNEIKVVESVNAVQANLNDKVGAAFKSMGVGARNK